MSKFNNTQEDGVNLKDAQVKIEKESSSKEFTPEQKRELNYAKSLHALAEMCQNYSALFAGFEGFIINSYVRSDQLTNITPPIEIGFLFIFLSLFGNILVTTLSLMLSGLIKSGVALGEYWWMKLVLRICVFVCMISSVLYAIAFQLYVADSVVRLSIKIFIWVFSSILVVGVVAFFLYSSSKTFKIDKEESERVIEFMES